VVAALYNTSQQSMPAGPLISAFVPSEQTALSQLANAYCSEMLASAPLTHAFFSGGLDGSLALTASGFFGASGSPQRAVVINALVANAIGPGVSPQAASAVTSEIDALISRVPGLNASATVAQAATAACTAVLGSAAVTLQ
ncbi:MAG: hypothetical protein JO361_02185, partial [Gammaproteobacteria bacterium]|nr:hypothetical protein [Gammaproteobacteria bacterium]